MPVHEIRHPLIRHKLGLMRRADISTKNFRELAQELGALLTYEATQDLPLEETSIEGWCGTVPVERIAGKKITVVPILRAGIGMLDGVLSLIPSAKVSVIGLARNEETLEAQTYLEKLVPEIDRRLAMIVDPMLATGGSLIATIDLLKQAGCKEIRALVLSQRPRASGRSRRPTRTCASIPRPSTSASTPMATSFPAWAMPATRSSAPDKRLVDRRRAPPATSPVTQHAIGAG